MKAAKKSKEEVAFPEMYCEQARLVEGAVLFRRGDRIPDKLIAYDRIVFLLAKEWIRPAGGYQELPEPYFTDVMETRD